jgi:Lon protease-like protein
LSVVTMQIPLFPLPLVLLPGARLPLHIFEPRYRQMLGDILGESGAHEFGIVFRPDGVAERDIPAGHIGCIAHVERSERLPDGRANVFVTGTRRFRLERFLDADRLYHVGEVSGFDDAVESPEELAPAADRLRELFHRVGTAARALADDADALPALPDDPAHLAFAIAAVIDMDAPTRQRLLSSRSPAERLRDVDALLSPAVDTLEQRAVVHARAKSNGHGPSSHSSPPNAPPPSSPPT